MYIQGGREKSIQCRNGIIPFLSWNESISNYNESIAYFFYLIYLQKACFLKFFLFLLPLHFFLKKLIFTQFNNFRKRKKKILLSYIRSECIYKMGGKKVFIILFRNGIIPFLSWNETISNYNESIAYFFIRCIYKRHAS